LHAVIFEFIESITKITRFSRTSWRVIFWIKVEEDFFAGIVCEAMRVTVLVGEGEGWGFHMILDFRIMIYELYSCMVVEYA